MSSDDEKRDEEIYNKNLLLFLIRLRDVGKETKYHIYDVLDPYHSRERKNQVAAIALVSRKEILGENFSVFKDFTDYLHQISYKSNVVSRIVSHGRIAVALNDGQTNFYEHGECRLLDPDKKILFKIIDNGIKGKPVKLKEEENEANIHDKGRYLQRMECLYEQFHDLSDAVLLLFSYYIPCTIDFHECSKLIREFVEGSGYKMAVGYESIYTYTNKKESLNYLGIKNIKVVDSTEFWAEIRNQMTPFINRDKFGTKYEFIDEVNHDDKFEEEFEDDVCVCMNHVRKRKFRKARCREIMKTYNSFSLLKY